MKILKYARERSKIAKIEREVFQNPTMSASTVWYMHDFFEEKFKQLKALYPIESAWIEKREIRRANESFHDAQESRYLRSYC